MAFSFVEEFNRKSGGEKGVGKGVRVCVCGGGGGLYVCMCVWGGGVCMCVCMCMCVCVCMCMCVYVCVCVCVYVCVTLAENTRYCRLVTTHGLHSGPESADI